MRESLPDLAVLIETKKAPRDLGLEGAKRAWRELYLLGTTKDTGRAINWPTPGTEFKVTRDHAVKRLEEIDLRASEYLKENFPQNFPLTIRGDEARLVTPLIRLHTEPLEVLMVRVTSDFPEGSAPDEYKKEWFDLNLIGYEDKGKFVFPTFSGCRVMARRSMPAARWFEKNFPEGSSMAFRMDEVEVVGRVVI